MSELDLLRAALPAYDFEDVLGRGAWGVVVAAQHRRLSRPVAVKMLPLAFTQDNNVRRRFAAEARVLATLDHPHVLRIHDYIEQDEVCALVMERLTGGTVAERMQFGPLRYETASGIQLATLHGLEHAHQNGVLHRDIKPENLMFAADGVLKIADFGIATVLGERAERMTATGVAMGTPAYMAPEQVQDADAVAEATDQWAAAAVYYEMLTGAAPYPKQATLHASLLARVRDDPHPITEIVPDLPADIGRAVMRALSRDPARRFATSAEFAAVLEDAGARVWGDGWVSSLPTPIYKAAPRAAARGVPTIGAVRPSPGPETRERIRRRSRRTNVVAAVSVAVLTAVTVTIGVVAFGGSDGNADTLVRPNFALVSSSLKGHGTAALADAATNTYWLAKLPSAGSNAHLSITYGFVNTFDLTTIAVWNGVGTARTRSYDSTLRPRSVELIFPGQAIPACGVTLPDIAGAAAEVDVRSCNANGVGSVRMRFNDYYSSAGANVVALASVEFYGAPRGADITGFPSPS